MSNVSVIQRMHNLLSTYDAKTVSAYEFEQSIELHMDALEGIDLAAIHRARKLAANVVRSHFYDAEEEFGRPGDAQAAIKELREFIESLPAG